MQPLKLFATATVQSLLDGVSSNVQRYATGDFNDLDPGYGWNIETTTVRWEPSVAAELIHENSPRAEIKNSLLIYRALTGMTPALARDERIWTRLCHVECLAYARSRWLRGDSEIEGKVRAHFFATSLPECRDGNALGRLWWSGHIANLACPEDLELGLERLLARANIRLQVFDRADTAFRQPLVAGIVRLLGDPWFASSDVAIADLMFEVNKCSGGIVFEALDTSAIDDHLAKCMERAKSRRSVL